MVENDLVSIRMIESRRKDNAIGCCNDICTGGGDKIDPEMSGLLIKDRPCLGIRNRDAHEWHADSGIDWKIIYPQFKVTKGA